MYGFLRSGTYNDFIKIVRSDGESRTVAAFQCDRHVFKPIGNCRPTVGIVSDEKCPRPRPLRSGDNYEGRTEFFRQLFDIRPISLCSAVRRIIFYSA